MARHSFFPKGILSKLVGRPASGVPALGGLAAKHRHAQEQNLAYFMNATFKFRALSFNPTWVSSLSKSDC